ncbi:glycosyltransferase, partial [Candidatus Uhrbacteria bacterium]|nr:glycosyltransferase [Candidatus Uhrbacteria bacterium]
MRVAILLVLHDGRDMLASFLESIQAQTHKDWQLIVIDEATTDGSSALVRQYVPHAVVLRNARDRGWAHGLNQAMRLALSHKNVDALLWTDTRMAFQPNCLERLVASFGDARVGVVGPVVFQMFEENRLEEALHERVESDYVYSAGMEGGCGGPYVLRGYGQRGHAGDDVRETLAVVRYALLVKRSALECARLHDELFVDTVLESEGVDVDLCLRVQNAGSRVCLVSDAHAYLACGVFKGVPRHVSPPQQLRLRCSSSQH